MINCQMLTEIYTFLKSKSRIYPHVAAEEVSRFFMNKLGFNYLTQFHRAAMHNITLEVCVQGELQKGEKSGSKEKKVIRH